MVGHLSAVLDDTLIPQAPSRPLLCRPLKALLPTLRPVIDLFETPR